MDGNNFSPFPHHKLQAFEVALEFIRLIRRTHISDAENRKHARASARSCARNLAEGAGRRSRADKRRCYSIAHGEPQWTQSSLLDAVHGGPRARPKLASGARIELAESVGCVEIDNAEGGCSEQQLQAVYKLGSRLNAMLTSLTR